MKKLTFFMNRNKIVLTICFILFGIGILSASSFTVKSESSLAVKTRIQGTDTLKRYGTFDVPTKGAENLDGAGPRVMALGDFDADGVNDLMVAQGNGLVLHRGDINAFAPKTDEAFKAIQDLRYISPFIEKTTTFTLPSGADYLSVGDFDRDSKLDVVAATRGGNEIFFLRGNGKGNFAPAQSAELPGALTAMASGDVNRTDGLADLVVGIGGAMPSVVVYDSIGDIFTNETRTIPVSYQPNIIAIGQLDDNSFTDIAVASDRDVTIIPGSDRDNGAVRPQSLPQYFDIGSMIIGDFFPDRDYRMELALLGSDGMVHIIKRGDLDTRPVTKREFLGAQVRQARAKGMPVNQHILSQLSADDLREPAPRKKGDTRRWSEGDIFPAGIVGEARGSSAVLTSGKLSNMGGDDLIVLNSSTNEITVMPLVFDSEASEAISFAGKRQSVKFDAGGAPIGVLVTRLNFDGDKDLLILRDGMTEPAVMLTAPEAAFVVNNSGDAVDNNIGNGVCSTAGGVCTLRAAIQEANRTAGNDSITINAGINITLTTGVPDNDAFAQNSASSGDLDIFCAINAGEDACVLPLNTNNNDLSITGAAGGNTISSGTFTSNGLTTTDRVFDIGMDGQFGGGFGAGTGIDVTMANLTIQNGNVREDVYTPSAGNFARGGGIRMDGFGPSGTRGSLTITSSTITNNQADHDTGGVFDQYASVSYSSVVTSNNIGKAGPGGGLQFLAGTPATLSVTGASSFTANQSRQGNVFATPATDTDGGGLSANMDSNTTTLTGVAFSNNISQDDGGALRLFAGAATVTGGSITGNTARDDGGGAIADNDTPNIGRFATFSGVTIRNNTADSDNTAAGDGGGLFFDRGTFNITNCTIGGAGAGEPNFARNGGGIAHAYRGGSNPQSIVAINIDNGSIIDNRAEVDGGGIYHNETGTAAAGAVTVGSTTTVAITSNKADDDGGGIYVSGAGIATLTRANLQTNRADHDNSNAGDGGAVHSLNGVVTVASTSTLSNNSGAENGGAISATGTGGVTLNNPTIANNTADQQGGSIHISGGTNTLNGISLTNNTSTGGTDVRISGGSTTLTGTLTVPGEFSITGGTVLAGSSTVNLGEDFHFTAGTFTAGTSTFNFNGGGAQQIYGGATPTFNNLSDSNVTQSLAINNNINVNGTLTANGAATVLNPAAASIIGGTGTLTGTGTARVTRTAATAGFLNQYTITNKTLTNLLVDYVGSAAQVLSATTYGPLRINNASGVTLTTGTANVDGTLTLTAGLLSAGAGTTLNINNGTSVAAGTIGGAATGTVVYNQGTNGQVVLVGNYGNLTFSNFDKTLPAGIVSIAGTFAPGTGTPTVTGNTINFNGAALQTIPVFPYNNLTLNNAAGANLGGNVTVNGALTLTSGTLGVGTNTLVLNNGSSQTGGSFSSAATGTVNYNQGTNGQSVLNGSYGNLTFSNFNKSLPTAFVNIAGVFTPGTGTPSVLGNVIVFNGASAQAIPVFPYAGLALNNAAGATLAGNTTVTESLTLTAGTLTTGAGNTLTVDTAGTSARTSGQVTGNLRKNYSGPGTFVFMVGTASGYAPVDTTVTAGAGNLTVTPVQGAMPPLPAATALARYWSLSGTGITTNLVFHYNQSDVNGNENNYRIHRKSGATTTSLPNNCPSATCVDPAANTGTVGGVSSFSDWTMAEFALPTAANVNVSGRVTGPDGIGISRAAVTMTDLAGNPRTAITNPFGFYTFTDVPAGAAYTFVVSAKGYRFGAPVIRTIGDDLTDMDFVMER
jgi:CSLREA domain-containing protein